MKREWIDVRGRLLIMSESLKRYSHAAVCDIFGRPLSSLRLSVTDRCNLRCKYCMPEEDYVWLPREDVLTHEEMAGLTGYFTDLGVDRVRLTGGEPLLRRDLPRADSPVAPKPAGDGYRADDEWHSSGGSG